MMEPIFIDNILHPLYVPHRRTNFSMIQDLKATRQRIVELKALVEEQCQAI